VCGERGGGRKGDRKEERKGRSDHIVFKTKEVEENHPASSMSHKHRNYYGCINEGGKLVVLGSCGGGGGGRGKGKGRKGKKGGMKKRKKGEREKKGVKGVYITRWRRTKRVG